MNKTLFAALAFSALLAVPASAASGSLGDFLQRCSLDSTTCKSFAVDIVTAAKQNHYDCIPQSLATDEAADRELDWLKDTASADPKYRSMDLTDVMWSGVDHLWPCHAKAGGQTAHSD